jgi:membrane-associated phospholipid phosphatase
VLSPLTPRKLLSIVAISTGVMTALGPATSGATEPLAQQPSVLMPASRPPALFSTRHLAYAAIGGTATWLAFEHENAASAASAIDDSPLDAGGDLGNQYGRASFLALGTAGLWAAGRIAGDPNVTGAARDLATGLLVNGAVVFALKTSIDRTRPNGEHWSFPSGHTASAFTVAPILNSRFGWRVGVPAYALAVATGLGRVEDHWHFPSDVIAGATLGLIVGETVARHSSLPHLPENLYVGSKGLGLQFGF